MATYRTTHFDMTIPDDSEPGPAFSSDISIGCLQPLGEHTHDGINTGPLINIAAQNVNNDLSLSNFNQTNIRASRFASQSSPLSGVADINQVYVVNGDLYYNNGSGVQIRLTINGVPVSSMSSMISFTPVAVTNSNKTILSTDADCHSGNFELPLK